MSDCATLEARLDDLADKFSAHEAMCSASTALLSSKLSRIMTAALGDHDMGTVGFIENGRVQHEMILKQVTAIHESQSESSKHRTLHVHIPEKVTKLAASVDNLMKAAHEEEITMRAYRRLVGWVIVGVNGSWAAGIAIWSVLT